MGQNILIAETREILRIGLRTIFVEDTRVSNVHEAATDESLKTQLLYSGCELDLVVINQSLVTDVSILPKGNFVILTNEPDLTILKAAYEHGARGYLSENTSAELLRMILHPTEGSFLIEPKLAPWIMEYIFGGMQTTITDELLTPREKEVISLLRGGLNRHSIAEQLSITDATLKTHIKNIARKREIKQRSREDIYR